MTRSPDLPKLLLFSVLLIIPSTVSADLMLDIGSVTVAPGGTGFMDVFLSSDDVNTDVFFSYAADFLVSGGAQAAAPINFVPSAIPAPQLSLANYVFFGNSLEADPVFGGFGIDFVSDSDPGSLPNADDLVSVYDETLDFSNRTITSAHDDLLLARLNFVAPTNATLGSVYDVTLDDLFLSLVDFSQSSTLFTSNTGSITISAAAAVPEASTWTMALLIGAGFLWRSRRKTATEC